MSEPESPKTETLDMGARTLVGTGLEIDGGNTLPLGHRLQEYVIEGLVGEGGFGIVYLARDTQLGRVVALKEYMPASLATRTQTHEVSVRSARHRETFELGLRSFVNEAQLLASFDHPSLVKVYRFWEQYGTAYMVMPYYQGPTLKQWLTEHGARADESWLISLLHPLIDALELMHHEHCYHRDIAPDNILLLNQQATQLGKPQTLRPVLLDFGAARRVIGDATQALTVILKSGYAPIEQYAESTSMKQGPWTDVYALSAVLYAAITGRAPLPSVSRMVSDDLVPAAKAGAGHYTPEFLAAVDIGLSVRPEQRPQDMAAMRALFTPGTQPQVAHAQQETDMVTVMLPTPRPKATLPQATKPASAPPPSAGTSSTTTSTTTTIKPHSPAASRAGLWVGAGVAALALVAAVWWFGLHGKPPVPEVPAVVVAPNAPVAVASAPALVPAVVPAVVPATTPAVAVAAAPFGIVTALQDIVRQADPLLGVNALADKSSLVIGRDKLQFRVKSSEAGYVYLFFAGTDKSHMYLLFPNEIDKSNRIEANKEMLLPRKGWQITAGGPAGTNHIVAVVPRQPRDFAQAGLRKGDEIPEFDLAQAERLWGARTGTENPFVGKAVCAAGATCDATFGATLLTIDEVAGKAP